MGTFRKFFLGSILILFLVFLDSFGRFAPNLVNAQEGVRVTHGPVVGAVTATSARVFVRTSSDAQVNLRYSRDANFASFLESESALTDQSQEWTTQIPLANLQPLSRYYLEVVIDDSTHPENCATFKTFAVPGSDAPTKFVVLNDFGAYGEGNQPPLDTPSPTFANAAAENPDFVFIGGDFDHRNPHTLQDRQQMFQDLYALNNPRSPMDVFVTEILPGFALAHQCDDHDFAGNDSDRLAPDRLIAKQVFTQYFPAYPYGGSAGIYQKFSTGNADFFVLDNRSARDRDNLPDRKTKSMLDGEHLGSQGQLAWLRRGLLQSRARWKIIFSSSVFNTTLGKSDSWHAFQYEHDYIVNLVKSHHIQGVIVISGDIHVGAMDDGSNAGLPNMVVPGVNLKYCSTVPEGEFGRWSGGYYGGPTHNLYTKPCNGYGVVTLNQKHARLLVKNELGKTKLKLVLKPITAP